MERQRVGEWWMHEIAPHVRRGLNPDTEVRTDLGDAANLSATADSAPEKSNETDKVSSVGKKTKTSDICSSERQKGMQSQEEKTDEVECIVGEGKRDAESEQARSPVGDGCKKNNAPSTKIGTDNSMNETSNTAAVATVDSGSSEAKVASPPRQKRKRDSTKRGSASPGGKGGGSPKKKGGNKKQCT